MPKVKQDLSPQAVNCLTSIFHRPKPTEGIPFDVIFELHSARLAKTRNYDDQPHVCITPAGKVRVQKWGG